MKIQVAGFVIDEEALQVALILKNRPAYLADQWNGIGGSVDPGETPEQAMEREFFEETGVAVTGFLRFAIYKCGPHGTLIHWFIACTNRVSEVRSTTDEEVRLWPTGKLPLNCVHNVPALFDMALQVSLGQAPGFEIVERDLRVGTQPSAPAAEGGEDAKSD